MQPQRVLFALTAESKRDFLPGFDSDLFPTMLDKWVDPNSLAPGKWEAILDEFDPEVIVTGWNTPTLPEAYSSRSESALGYVCHLTGSVRYLLPRALLERGVLVTNWGSSISHSIAEHALLLILGSLRNMPLWKEHLISSGNRHLLQTRCLRGKRVGLHGFGSIARELLFLLKPFGVQLSAYSKGVPAELFAKHEVGEKNSLEELFAGSDIVIECEALTPETTGMVTRRHLDLLPHGAVFVNVGRGAIVDEAALAEAAETGKIRYASDVFIHEPLPSDSPLRRIPSALLSPHIAGPTLDILPVCGNYALENLRSYLAGRPDQMEGQVTLAVYDRST